MDGQQTTMMRDGSTTRPALFHRHPVFRLSFDGMTEAGSAMTGRRPMGATDPSSPAHHLHFGRLLAAGQRRSDLFYNPA